MGVNFGDAVAAAESYPPSQSVPPTPHSLSEKRSPSGLVRARTARYESVPGTASAAPPRPKIPWLVFVVFTKSHDSGWKNWCAVSIVESAIRTDAAVAPGETKSLKMRPD